MTTFSVVEYHHGKSVNSDVNIYGGGIKKNRPIGV